MPLVGTQGSAYPYPSNRAIVPGKRFVQRDLSGVYHQTWGNALQPAAAQVAPTAAVANDILTATAGPNVATITPALVGTLVTGGIATLNPAYGPWCCGRNVVVTVTHATSIVAVNGVVTGIDIYGRVIAENWSVTATGTSKTYATLKAFKFVTGFSIISAGNATTDTITVGDGNVFGLDVKCFAGQAYAAGITGFALKELVNSAIVTTGVIIPFDPVNSGSGPAFTADPRGTYTPASAPNGAQKYDLWYITDDPEFSDALG